MTIKDIKVGDSLFYIGCNTYWYRSKFEVKDIHNFVILEQNNIRYSFIHDNFFSNFQKHP
jgi:hypothetical protein